ncbi:hypothetical protein CYLTODRAFT_491348 [Cylindrobasidium torrendii FP15055 ss-10]|uniref:F-box domain-containing protein n=1 Tax=Cylindrobasidium torrendii FP15055 ss-10 TaxID=1314674 RepID=A0A0D7B7P1_9AGAR|nr:hypothetical protein CYLTODRAFT_491348 [Cylindrobasidium torrendii FP15055 ss-10]
MPPKRTKSAKPSEQKAQTADTSVTRCVGGKRKRVDATAPTRGRRGNTAKKVKLEEIVYFRLLDVPADVLYEICSYLHPLMVLYLSRACKTLRSIFMSEASRYAWRTSFESIFFDGIRDVRSDICEPRLANLLFEDRCDRCLKSRKGEFPQFMLRVNLCQTCLYKSPDFLPAKFLRETAEEANNGKYVRHLGWIKRFTPSTPSLGYFGTPELFDRASFVEMVEETKDLTLDEFCVWRDKEKENFESLKDECRQLKEFKIEMAECAALEKAEKRRAAGVQRRKDIAARLAEAGYTTNRPGGEADEEFWGDVLRTLSRDKLTPSRYRTLISRQAPLTDKEWKEGDILKCLIDCGKIVEGDKLRAAREKKGSTGQRAKTVAEGLKRGAKSLS